MKKVAIVGAGRMGETLARKLADRVALFLYDIDQSKTRKLAQELKVQIADLNKLAEMEVIFLALPTGVMAGAVQGLQGYLNDNTILVNIATSCSKKVIVDVLGSGEKVVSAKFVGHAKEILAGEPPAIVIDAPTEQVGAMVAEILASMGKAIFASEDIVAKLNVLAAEEGIYAALKIKKKMEEAGLPEELYTAAVRGVAAGTMKAYVSGDAGPFVQDIVKRILAEME